MRSTDLREWVSNRVGRSGGSALRQCKRVVAGFLIPMSAGNVSGEKMGARSPGVMKKEVRVDPRFRFLSAKICGMRLTKLILPGQLIEETLACEIQVGWYTPKLCAVFAY